MKAEAFIAETLQKNPFFYLRDLCASAVRRANIR